jgi:PTS system galactitol-specific IIB component
VDAWSAIRRTHEDKFPYLLTVMKVSLIFTSDTSTHVGSDRHICSFDTRRYHVTKRVLVICGTGVATSTVVATKVRDYCLAQGIDVQVSQGKVMDLLSGGPAVDLIVATTQVPSTVTAPVVAGLPFLTGIGVDAALAEVGRHLAD